MKKNLIRQFWHDRSANVLMLTGLGFLFLVGIGGAGYDLGRQQLVRQKVQQAADAAALGAASMAPGSTVAQRQGTANAFFNLNYPTTYLGVNRPTPTVNVASKTVSVEASTTVNTSFVRTFGVKTITTGGRSTVNIRSDFNTIDLILVMDNSGSMKAKDVGGVDTSSATTANVISACIETFGASNAAWCNGPIFLDATERGLTGATRLNAVRDAADYAADKLLNPNPNANRIATVMWDDMLHTSSNFAANYPDIRSALQGMFAYGDTNSSIGLQRAIEFMPYARSNAVRAIILLTDGANTQPSNAVANAQSLVKCDALKAMPNTVIYTIAFGTEINTPVVRQFLSDCASGDHGPTEPNLDDYFFITPDASELQAIFDNIVGDLQRVRILN
ncbi:MAG: vWA domain-containing protein [Rickettsiales bacterium]